MNMIEERLDAMLKTFEENKEDNGIISNSILAVLRYIKMGDGKAIRDELKNVDKQYWGKIQKNGTDSQ